MAERLTKNYTGTATLSVTFNRDNEFELHEVRLSCTNTPSVSEYFAVKKQQETKSNSLTEIRWLVGGLEIPNVGVTHLGSTAYVLPALADDLVDQSIAEYVSPPSSPSPTLIFSYDMANVYDLVKRFDDVVELETNEKVLFEWANSDEVSWTLKVLFYE